MLILQFCRQEISEMVVVSQHSDIIELALYPQSAEKPQLQSDSDTWCTFELLKQTALALHHYVSGVNFVEVKGSTQISSLLGFYSTEIVCMKYVENSYHQKLTVS